ncbi:hypothetical protein AMELA_G00088720 [Ameiurus melas]|uniref:Ig-like domain-containing protein n=1 Tax=Ameiurus melas TaxID=219545 RepID=A0A7J6AXE0_AMEME|nr:hypothetical protein AMELA_G00088720 [Ameiurus melas]
MDYFNLKLTAICMALLLRTTVNAIRVIGQDATVVAGDDARLFCQLVDTAEKLTSVTWQRRTKERPTNTDFLVVASDGKEEHMNGLKDRVKFTGDIPGLKGSILLSNITVSDEGIYTCIFSIFPSGPFKTEIHLTVQVPPVVIVSTDVPPVAGDTEEILATCTASNAKPAAEVSWNLGDLNYTLKVQTNVIVDSEGRHTVKSSLIGVASKDLNRKKVQCLVSHPGLKEKLKLDYTLIIHYPPQVVYIISVGGQGETREFQYEADANPKPTNFTWSRHFPVKEPLSRGVNNRLIIQMTPASNGLYYCVVSNQYGSSTECTSFWTLVIVALLAGVSGFLIWKFNLHQSVFKRLRCFRGDPVPTVSSDLDEVVH